MVRDLFNQWADDQTELRKALKSDVDAAIQRIDILEIIKGAAKFDGRQREDALREGFKNALLNEVQPIVKSRVMSVQNNAIGFVKDYIKDFLQ